VSYDVEAVRAEFPILTREVHGKPLIYLDSGASAQKPRAVIEAMRDSMERHYANVHRGLHTLASETTDAYERARESVRRFINAASANEVVFT
jgi:cysteine desulfurase/selenocysteine lyase